MVKCMLAHNLPLHGSFLVMANTEEYLFFVGVLVGAVHEKLKSTWVSRKISQL